MKKVLERVAEKQHISQAAAKRCIDAFIKELRAELLESGSVNIKGFAKFKVAPARSYSHPQTGKLVTPADGSATIKVSLSNSYKKVRNANG